MADTYNDYLERLSLLNKDHETRSVWTSIDRPMRPLIYQLHRLGMSTKFSCCGFSYEGEEEPKSHHSLFPYVFIYKPTSLNQPYQDRTIKGMEILNKNLKEHLQYTKSNGDVYGWKISDFHDCYNLYYTHGTLDMYQKKDNLDTSIHDYEEYVLGIHHITRCLSLEETIVQNEDIQVIDGNNYYLAKGIEEWQVKPKQTGLVTDDIIDQLTIVDSILDTKIKE